MIERIYKTNPQCKSEVILANDYLSFLVPSNNVVNETAVSGTPSENDPLSSILSVDTKKWEICDNFFLENQRRLARMKPKANNV